LIPGIAHSPLSNECDNRIADFYALLFRYSIGKELPEDEDIEGDYVNIMSLLEARQFRCRLLER
jgi:hypothetical protein